MSEIKEEGKCLLYDPYNGQFFHMTMDEAKDHINRNPDIYTGDLVSSIVQSKNNDINACLIMQIKEEERYEMKYWETDFNRDEQPVIDELRKNGYFVYGLRDDFGDSYSVEPRVIINRIGFIVTDEPIKFHGYPPYITDEELTEIGVADKTIRDVILETVEKMK